jgi:hypothetical protein
MSIGQDRVLLVVFWGIWTRVIRPAGATALNLLRLAV